MISESMRNKACLFAMAAMLGIGAPFSTTAVQAATEHFNDASYNAQSWKEWKNNWESTSTNYENVSLTPGVDQTQLNFAWYSKTAETPKVRIATTKRALTSATEFTGTQDTENIQTIDETAYYSCKVTVTGLKENMQYYYQVYQDGTWQEIKKYSTKSFSSFSFLYVGDPQIGASKGQTTNEGDTLNEASTTGESNLAARNDGFNWNETLNEALGKHDVSFLVSAGDQVNTSNNEVEYAAYLGADALSSLPVATTIGNHDSTNIKYSLHYNNPNSFDGSDTAYTAGKTAAGTDYYYRYGNTLFIVLDTNNYNCATHENVIKKAVNENEDAKWRVVTFHQDIYGSGKDHSDSDGMVLRTQLTPIMDEYDIDVVLQGHDHTYSRTYQITSDGAQHTAYSTTPRGDETYLSENASCYTLASDAVGGTVTNPEGTVYLEANSATGSKYYNLIATQQDYISERSQTWTPSYSVVSVDDNTFSVTTYDASTGRTLGGSSTYTIKKEDKKADTKSDQSIKATTSYTKHVGDASFNLNAKADGTLTYRSDNENVALVSRSGRVTIVGAGTAKITVTAAATDTKNKASKTIIIKVKAAENAPSQTAIKSLKSSKKRQITVTWRRDAKATGYEVVYSTSKSFKKNVKKISIKSNKIGSVKLKKLTSKKKVYVKVRAYKVVNGKKLYGKYSTIKKIRVK